VSGHTVGYYRSVGGQIGAQSRAIVFLFMTDESARRFRSTVGWSEGGDASVAVMKTGANGNLDTEHSNRSGRCVRAHEQRLDGGRLDWGNESHATQFTVVRFAVDASCVGSAIMEASCREP
jgi:hypothetical protein